MKNRVLSLLTAVMLLLGPLVPATAAATGGEAALSRAEFITMLYQIAGEPEVAAPSCFTDVTVDAPYASAVAWAEQAGVVSGVGGALFAPDLEATREQAAVIMLNYANSLGAGHRGDWVFYLDYPDAAAISDWAVEGVMYAKTHALTDEKPGGMFDPTGTITQDEASAWLARLLEATVPAPDVDDAITLSNTDYSDLNNWLSFGGDGSKDVDIFVVYPTVASSVSMADIPYMRLSSEIMRTLGGEWLSYMDDIINPEANVYAPLYRQVNAASLPLIDSAEFEPIANRTPREDIFAAFAYYLENINQNQRPFILLGHSQGGYMVAELATTFLGSDKYSQYNKNHIATYAIGVSVTPDYLAKNPHLQFSQSPADTGVIVSWNSTSPNEAESGAYKKFITWREGALTTNPLTWTTDETPAPAAPFVKSYNGALGTATIAGTADATVDKTRGLLMVSTVDETAYESILGGLLSRYHNYDVWFFADSLTQNIKDRITAFK